LKYFICGICIETDIYFPDSYIGESLSTTDVRIRTDSIPLCLDRQDHDSRVWSVAEGDFLLRIPGLMRLLVRAGREMVVEPAPGIAVDETVPFILSTGFAALLHQRSILALHAATVSWQGKAIALCGPTGTGKSTLATALCQEGARFVGDDIAAIRPGDDGCPMVYPDGRQHRLWADAVAHLGLADRQGGPVRTELNKFHVAPDVEPGYGPVPLSTIVLLENRPDKAPPSPPMITDLPLVDALPLLREQIYRPKLAERMGHDTRIFMQTADLLNHVRVLRLERDRTLADLRTGAQMLLSRMAEIG
jgi:hypothetical protein